MIHTCKVLIATVVTSLFLTACASHKISSGNNIVGPVSDGQYEPVIDKYSDNEKEYSGFHNTYQATMTILNSEVQNLALQRRGHFLQWDLENARQQREKMFQEMSSKTQFFLAFFSPEHDYDDLGKPKSIWKIFLVVDGQRFQGKVKKATQKFVELQELFPYIERFHTPYYVEFNIPITGIETKELKVILTSSLGKGEFQFPAMTGY